MSLIIESLSLNDIDIHSRNTYTVEKYMFTCYFFVITAQTHVTPWEND